MKFTKPSTRTRFFFAVQQFAVLGGTKARLRTDDKSAEFEMILPNNVEVSSVTALALLAERQNGSREILIGAGYISISQGLPRDRNIRLTYDKAPDQSGAPEGYEIYRIKPAELSSPVSMPLWCTNLPVAIWELSPAQASATTSTNSGSTEVEVTRRG